MTDRVGFIGVGAMGSAIASRLVDTCTLYINDRNPAAGEKLIQQGAVFATAGCVGNGEIPARYRCSQRTASAVLKNAPTL